MSWSHRKQLTGILNTKERKNEAKRKSGSLVVQCGGGGRWGAAELMGLALQPGPQIAKDLILPRARKGPKVKHSPGVEARKRERH